MFFPRRHKAAHSLLFRDCFVLKLTANIFLDSERVCKGQRPVPKSLPCGKEPGSRFPEQSKRSLVAAGLSNLPTPPREPPTPPTWGFLFRSPVQKKSQVACLSCGLWNRKLKKQQVHSHYTQRFGPPTALPLDKPWLGYPILTNEKPKAQKEQPFSYLPQKWEDQWTVSHSEGVRSRSGHHSWQ